MSALGTAGEKVLLLDLGEQELKPFPITTKKAEHISATFEPFSLNSLLAGFGPADVHIREPRSLPLITSGASVVGDGVLAFEVPNVVVCQLVPWQFDYAKSYNLKRTYRRTAFLLSRLLCNLGATSSTPLLARFHAPVTASESVARWHDGLYLDQPEEWDDPYRFFRW